MRQQFASYIRDPETKTGLDLKVLERDSEHVVSGVLTNDASWYPIIAGVPRLLMGDLKTDLLRRNFEFLERFDTALPERARHDWHAVRSSIDNVDAFLEHQRRTAESFAYEWEQIYRENEFERENFFHFLHPFVRSEDLVGRTTLDIGCGSGRFTKWAALSGASAAFGSDIGESVAVAYQMTRDIPNACIVQADIYSMPFERQFDFAYSIGVLHHLPKPEEGFSKLPHVLSPGGRMLIWVYNRRNNGRALYLYEPLRSVLRRVPKPLLFKLCYIPALAVHGVNAFGRVLGRVGLESLEKNLPFAYYRNFPFNMKLNDAFDVLATPKSNYYFVEDIRQWFIDAGLSSIAAYEHAEAGITCVGYV
ncbi:MAG TPA: class I SAM-dependent methyltransferase [Burkholderiales bacterium]|nr:class I SAM-dependent methyltransferase [Burkholderiales bacterium]